MQDSSHNIIIKNLPTSSERLPLFIVGDVHGCARELAELIRLAKTKVNQFQLVLVGDLFTKGPDPLGVFEIIHEQKAICVKGNHDWALASAIYHSKKHLPYVYSEHTKQTLHILRYHKRTILDFINSIPHAIKTEVIPESKQPTWEQSYPMIIVHAGIDCTVGLNQTTERMLLTARYVRWDSKGSDKKLMIVPSGYRSEILGESGAHSHYKKNELFLNERFHWHELHNGPELIVFGHDAKQGLFRKTLPTGRPICVGIDTGCTYGHQLTGYFPELDLAIQVKAARKYFDISKNVIILKHQPSNLAAV